MNSHERLQSDLLDLVHRELSPWRGLQVRFHLAHCADCSAEHKRLETLWSSLRALHAPSTTPTRLRPKLKDKPMQARMILVTATAAFCAVGGPLITRSRKQHDMPDSYKCFLWLSSIQQFATITGDIRGNIQIYDPKGTILRGAWIRGSGTSDKANLILRSCKDTTNGTTCHNEKNLGSEIASGIIRMNQTTEIRDRIGNLIATVKLTPLNQEQEKIATQQKVIDDAMRQRNQDLYKNPACFSRDLRIFSRDYQYTVAEVQPGLVAWATSSVTSEDNKLLRVANNFKYPPLESEGYGWKVLGEAQVTMTLLTDKTRTPYIRHYKTEPLQDTREFALREGLLQKGTPPKIYWAQSAPASVGTAQGVVKLGNYWVNENGGWATVARSGEFTGYGKHIINGPDGKPQLILEVLPL